MSYLSSKAVNNSHPKKKQSHHSSSDQGPDEPNEVLDLRKSNSEKLCFWCGKQGSLSENGIESDFCSEICFDQFRRDSFKKRSSCIWCNNSNQGAFNVNSLNNLDESRFCSEYCLTQFKVRLFCEETSAHLNKLKDGSLSVMNGLTSTASQSSNRSPLSIAKVPAESTVGIADLITPDLWLKKSPNKSSSTCTTTSPFHNSHSPRRSSTSPPFISASPSSDVETLTLGETAHGKGSGSVFLNRLQGITTMPLSSCPNKLSSVISTPGSSVGSKKKGHNSGNDMTSGEILQKRSRTNSQPSGSEFSNWNTGVAQLSKGSSSKASHLKGIRGRKGRIMERRAEIVKETPMSVAASAKGTKQYGNINSGLPFQHAGSIPQNKPCQIIPHPPNIFMANRYSNKINFGNLGLALSGGYGFGEFPTSFLPGDDNSTESSSSCSTTSQVLGNVTKQESLPPGRNQTISHGLQNRESQTDADTWTQSHESGPPMTNASSSLPQVTVLVPFPIAVPIPIPIPIPIILGPGFNMTEKPFSSFKGTNDDLSNPTSPETSTSQINGDCNISSNQTDVSQENDTDDNQINSSSNSKAAEGKEGNAKQGVCGLVKVEDSLSAAR